jgi:hypothetical protein
MTLLSLGHKLNDKTLVEGEATPQPQALMTGANVITRQQPSQEILGDGFRDLVLKSQRCPPALRGERYLLALNRSVITGVMGYDNAKIRRATSGTLQVVLVVLGVSLAIAYACCCFISRAHVERDSGIAEFMLDQRLIWALKFVVWIIGSPIELVLPEASSTKCPDYGDPWTIVELIQCWLEEGYVASASEAALQTWAMRARLSRLFRVHVTRFPEHMAGDMVTDVRAAFARYQIKLGKCDDNPHARDASIRRAGTALIEKCLRGRKRFDIQSNRSTGSEYGSSLVFDPVDVIPEVLPRQVEDDEDVVYTMIDVDFHTDMNYWIDCGRPILCYTMLPTCAAGLSGASSNYTFEDNKCCFRSHGGFCANHEIWDYGADICVSTYEGRTTWTKVMRYAMPAGRGVVALIPLLSMQESHEHLARMAPRHRLRRHVFNHKGTGMNWTAFKVWTRKGLDVTVAAAGPDSRAVTLPWGSFSEVIDTLRVLGGARVPEHTVHSICGSHSYLLCKYARDYLDYGHVLDTVHRGTDTVTEEAGDPGMGKCTCKVCVPPTDRGPNDPCHYKIGEHDSVDMKDTVSVFASGVMVDKVGATAVAVAPIRDKGAADKAAMERVVQPQQASAIRQDPKKVLPYIKPFVEALLKRIPKLDPVSEEEVLKRVKPSAREATAEGFRMKLTSLAGKIKPFIKGETYPEAKAPRLITPLHPALQSRLYKYAYALQDALHGQQWFAFGTTLPELGKRIAEMTRHAAFVVETDYSKYDGTIQSVARKVEQAVYAAYFPGHVGELRQLAKAQQHQEATVKGIKYDTGHSRSSGSPDTCLMNSILNMFSMFLAIGESAFDYALVGGDDGIVAVSESRRKLIQNGDCPSIRAASQSCGFDIKCSVKARDETFSFLARRFEFGGPDSICQPDRMMPKVHVLNHPNIPTKFLASRYRMKLESLILSDGNTPVIGDMLRQELGKLKGQKMVPVPDEYCRDGAWWADIMEGGPWPNKLQPWMAGEVARYVKRVGDKLELVTAVPPTAVAATERSAAPKTGPLEERSGRREAPKTGPREERPKQHAQPKRGEAPKTGPPEERKGKRKPAKAQANNACAVVAKEPQAGKPRAGGKPKA